jgi:hypothetical protein
MVTFQDKENWFYSHDNEWQNDIEIDFQSSKGKCLITWAYNRYHK